MLEADPQPALAAIGFGQVHQNLTGAQPLVNHLRQVVGEQGKVAESRLHVQAFRWLPVQVMEASGRFNQSSFRKIVVSLLFDGPRIHSDYTSFLIMVHSWMRSRVVIIYGECELTCILVLNSQPTHP
jgi:hypothetical protein